MHENLISDAHCHNDADSILLKEQRRTGILATVNCAGREEWLRNKTHIGQNQRLSFGVHPWQSDQMDLPVLQAYFEKATVIGEIGLDHLWTDVPLDIQRPVFAAQLQIAAKLGKPVILHTKGCEAECLSMIQKTPNRYFVHWYSDTLYQQAYLNLGCYMSVGPDVVSNSTVATLAKCLPLDHLLLESDGIESIEWAWHRPVGILGYEKVMQQLAESVADLRGISVQVVQRAAAANLKRFWGE